MTVFLFSMGSDLLPGFGLEVAVLALHQHLGLVCLVEVFHKLCFGREHCLAEGTGHSPAGTSLHLYLLYLLGCRLRIVVQLLPLPCGLLTGTGIVGVVEVVDADGEERQLENVDSIFDFIYIVPKMILGILV